MSSIETSVISPCSQRQSDSTLRVAGHVQESFGLVFEEPDSFAVVLGVVL